jgi:D-glycero-D-manno-heptose 1,7-bisphosphate phosphatase
MSIVLNRNRAVFLDRDGTINHDVGYTHRVEDLRLLDHVVEGLQWLSKMGFKLIVTTNQAGIARGYFTEREVEAFNQHLLVSLQSHSVTIDGIYYCPHHPTEGIGKYRQDCFCRKPKPGMLTQAAKEHDIDLSRSYVIGDKKSDILAGKAVGCTTILVLRGVAGTGERELSAVPDYVACDLLDAALIIRRAELRRTRQVGGGSR